MSWLAAQQDFGAKILCDNLNALAVHAASESLDPNTRARYFINRGDTFSRIKRTLGRWLLQGLDALDNVASVFNELIKNLVQIKPNRSCPRKFHPKTTFITRLQKRGMTMDTDPPEADRSRQSWRLRVCGRLVSWN
jgi:hypothetical protein